MMTFDLTNVRALHEAVSVDDFHCYDTSMFLSLLESRCEMLTGMEVGSDERVWVKHDCAGWPILQSTGEAWALLPHLPYHDVMVLMRDVTTNVHTWIDGREDRLQKIRFLHAESPGLLLAIVRKRGSPHYDGAMRGLLTWCVLDCFLNDRSSTVTLPEWYGGKSCQ